MTRRMRAKPGAMQERYVRLGRVDLVKGGGRWWVTVWMIQPPAIEYIWQSISESWHLGGYIRVVHRWRKFEVGE